jgi:hypothetical protein
MSESSTSLDCLQGLEEFFDYTGQRELRDYLHTITGIEHADNPLAVLKKLTLTSSALGPELLSKHLNCYINLVQGQFDLEQVVSCARDYEQHSLLTNIQSFGKQGSDLAQLNDAFSRSQIRSKIWLVEQLAMINSNYTNVAVMASWFGQIKTIYDKRLTYSKMRLIELDRVACETSDYVFNLSNLENHKVKAVCADINGLTLHKNGYKWPVENFKDGTQYSEKFLPDLVINTSAEHMTEEWFHQLRFKQLDSDPIVAIQSNNLFDIHEHINCVHSVDHMKKKFPMREVLFAGELQLKGYKRVMLIGKP